MSFLNLESDSTEVLIGSDLTEIIQAALIFEEVYRKHGVKYESQMSVSEDNYQIIYKLWELPQDNLEN